MAKRNAAVVVKSESEVMERDAPTVTPEAPAVNPPQDLRDAEPTEAELAEVATELANLAGEELAEGALARYFRDMSAHPVMDPAEEVRAAEGFLTAEIDRWKAVLAYPPAFPIVERVIRECLADLAEPVVLPEFEGFHKVLADFRKNRSKFDRKLQGRWDALVETAAVSLRALDADRLFIEAVDEELSRVAGEVDDDEVGAGADEESGTVLSAGFKRYLASTRAARDAVYRVKNRFVAANLRLVVSIARRYNRGRMPLIDIIQEGNMGLIKAVERFDHHRGYRFSTYASWWIRHAISRGLADKGRAVRIPVHMLDTYNRVQRTVQALTARTGREPTVEELSAETGISLEKLDRMQRDWAETPFSLDRPVNEEDGKRLIDCLQDEKTISPFEQVATTAWSNEVQRLLDTLSPIEARIIRWRFGLDDEEELTLKEIGDKYNLSRERIRQLQEQALAKIRRQVRE
ncbi:MAG: sigma-70 family RNA polymerase sigma factor [Polyangiales bacterium]